ncbi:energy transducer TonB [Sphingomonas sp. RT2P30]|uniref:energy transducer TonB n=1 Tax=Parasphingomonas halimpatiens TaxID=3096162 RepID=UPI002FC9149E
MNVRGRYAVTAMLAMIPAVAGAVDLPRWSLPHIGVPVVPALPRVPVPVPLRLPEPGVVWPAPLPQDATRPKIIGNPGEYFGENAYPPAAVRAGEQGRTVARVLVDEHGSPSACHVEASSGSVELDTATCRIARARLHFVPAHDAQNNPLASSYLLPVRWVLPEPDPTPRTAFSRVTRAELSASGTVISCTTTAIGAGSGSFDGDFCAEMRNESAIGKRVVATSGGKRTILWMQLAVTFDGDAPFREEHKHVGRSVIGIGRFHLSIARDGIVTACEVVEQAGAFASAPICDNRFDRYTSVTTAEKGAATVLFSFSTTPAPAVAAAPVRKGAHRARRGAYRVR